MRPLSFLGRMYKGSKRLHTTNRLWAVFVLGAALTPIVFV